MRLLPLIFLWFLVPVLSADVHEERLWTGKNKQTFRGKFVEVDEESGRYRFADARGVFLLIDPANISERDLTWLKEQWAQKDAAEGAEQGLFLRDPVMDRSLLPVIDQADYGSKASDCVPSSMCNFLLWWDQCGYLEIPKKGDFERKADWVHTRLARYCVTRNNSGTGLLNAVEGLREYFTKHHPGKVNFLLHQEVAVTPELLTKYADGALMTILELTVMSDRKKRASHWVALREAEADGSLTIQTWGKAISGKLVVINAQAKPPENFIICRNGYWSSEPIAQATHYRFVPDANQELPEHMTRNSLHFELNPAEYDSLIVIAPYRYVGEGDQTVHPHFRDERFSADDDSRQPIPYQ
ncbi:MAG: hypothetical protein ACQKBY_08720 [Verrucomicrobiales bacterium]